ncbi:hypothetical protein PsorP6_014526 [Peronosclerospora sorghi]|uniref:Uncharacterized protein n=1 Tax=Peronosclerospora sorghi TaxID=230839 RepID=A0ACC0VTZ2_9STRA|nr:hypothetical protein PsorP6_014526 [Peronosclerospora sorghi]
MLDVTEALDVSELKSFIQHDDDWGDLELGQLDPGASMFPASLFDKTEGERKQWTVAWTESMAPSPHEKDEEHLVARVSREPFENGTDKFLRLTEPTATQFDALIASLTHGDTKQRGRTSCGKANEIKPKRAPPSEAKAKLRNYERRSRRKREHTMISMKKAVAMLEAQIKTLCASEQRDTHLIKHKIATLIMEATDLANANFQLQKAIDEHQFFHSMLQIEYNHRDRMPHCAVGEAFSDLSSWRPLDESTCLRLMRDSFLEIEAFSTSEDFVSSGWDICGWREKRKLVGNKVKFIFHKTFAKDCSEALAARSWEMRAVQDQATEYFGHSLDVQVQVVQRIENNVVVVRRKIKHPVDKWVHYTIYLLFRTKTRDGHLVCIRDMNPKDTDALHLLAGSSATAPSPCVIWSKAFIWWKFTTLPEKEDEQHERGFEVEYGGSLSSASQADAAFWMREVLVLALRWENLVVGPLITLS